MKLIIPNNIFATLFLMSIDEEERPEIIVKDSALLISELENSKNSIALVPSFDLIDNRELFVSSKLGLAFEGLLSNSYIYYFEANSEIKNLQLRGDISKNDVILSKILFRERYNLNPEISLDTSKELIKKGNFLISASENWKNNLYKNGVSFSEQISDILNFPYVNFLFVSNTKDLIQHFNNMYKNITQSIISNLERNLTRIGLSDEVNKFIKKELPSIYYEFTEAEIEGLKDLLQLAYFHQIFDDIFDIKFV